MRGNNTTLLDTILENVVLEYLKSSEDIEIAEKSSMDFVLEHLSIAFGNALSTMNADLKRCAPKAWKVKETITRRPLSEFGQISYEKTVYIDEAGERRHFLDEIVGMPEHSRMTPNMARMLAENATSTSYSHAADVVSRHCRASVSQTAIAGLITEIGETLSKASQTKARDLFEYGLDQGGQAGNGNLFVEADGVWVSTTKRGHTKGPRKTEIKNYVAYTNKNDHKLENRVIFTGVDTPANFWKNAVAQTASIIDFSSLDRVRLGCDGGPWCKNGVDYLPGNPELNLDAWHINHNINLAFKDKQEAKTAVDIIYTKGAQSLVDFIDKNYPHNQKAKKLKRYIGNNINIIDMSKNLGSIEGINAHVISDRMESWGCAWSKKNADAMPRCRAHRMNGKQLPVRQRSSWFKPGREERLVEAMALKKIYNDASIGNGYEYPQQVETKRMPARQRYLLTQCNTSSYPY